MRYLSHRTLVGIAGAVAISGGVYCWFWPGEPRYEGKLLSYWVDQLEPKIVTPDHRTEAWPPEEFRSFVAVNQWLSHQKELHEHAVRVIGEVGPEALPILYSRLTAKTPQFSRAVPIFRRLSYALHFSDSRPSPGHESDYGEVRRGQAVTALCVMGQRAVGLTPQLSALAAADDDDAAHRAASLVLWEIAPDEFRRVRNQAYGVSASAKSRGVEPDAAGPGR
jgi:hypothetical protein